MHQHHKPLDSTCKSCVSTDYSKQIMRVLLTNSLRYNDCLVISTVESCPLPNVNLLRLLCLSSPCPVPRTVDSRDFVRPILLACTISFNNRTLKETSNVVQITGLYAPKTIPSDAETFGTESQRRVISYICQCLTALCRLCGCIAICQAVARVES